MQAAFARWSHLARSLALDYLRTQLQGMEEMASALVEHEAENLFAQVASSRSTSFGSPQTDRSTDVEGSSSYDHMHATQSPTAVRRLRTRRSPSAPSMTASNSDQWHKGSVPVCGEVAQTLAPQQSHTVESANCETVQWWLQNSQELGEQESLESPESQRVIPSPSISNLLQIQGCPVSTGEANNLFLNAAAVERSMTPKTNAQHERTDDTQDDSRVGDQVMMMAMQDGGDHTEQAQQHPFVAGELVWYVIPGGGKLSASIVNGGEDSELLVRTGHDGRERLVSVDRLLPISQTKTVEMVSRQVVPAK